jgi:hypothetical protein
LTLEEDQLLPRLLLLLLLVALLLLNLRSLPPPLRPFAIRPPPVSVSEKFRFYICFGFCGHLGLKRILHSLVLRRLLLLLAQCILHSLLSSPLCITTITTITTAATTSQSQPSALLMVVRACSYIMTCELYGGWPHLSVGVVMFTLYASMPAGFINALWFQGQEVK